MLFTSQMESFSMVLLESKAHGLPCVMYDLPYLTLASDRKGFLSAPIGDIPAMSEHVLNILSDDALRNRLSREARDSFEAYAGYDYAEAWFEIFSLNFTSDRYYDPVDVGQSDRFIMPMLFDAWKKGIEYVLSNDRDRRVGEKILSIPRSIKRAIKGSSDDR